jgi:GWxTD domain-containing protein
MKKRWAILGVGLSLLLACSAGQMPKNLAPEEKEFLSNVRYIITGKERKAFLALPLSERSRFIEEFWKSRDPDPTTEVNEYKIEHLKRIAEAKHLFTEAAGTGWLTDRGRIYILLGPPEQREQYPQGYFNFTRPIEVWRYGFYELYFVDSRLNGNFELVPESAQLISEINTAQIQLRSRPTAGEDKALADFKVDVRKTSSDRERLIVVSIPYKDIWFSAEGKEFKANLGLTWEVYDAADKKIQEGTKAYPLTLTREQLKELSGREWSAEIPLELGPGDYQIALTMKNMTDQKEVRKRIKLTV